MCLLSVLSFSLYFILKRKVIRKQHPKVEGLLIAAGVLAIFAIVIFIFKKRIALVVQMFKEASKVLADVPLIVAEPMLTFLAMGLATAAFMYFALVIQSSGSLTVENDKNGKFFKATYEQDFGSIAAWYINIVTFIWFTQFILGCQHFVIAGVVCQWFFSRTKSKLASPIQRSFHQLLSVHIGSICLGAIFITLVKIIRMLVDSLTVRRTF